jgi:hypothetical protein
MEIYLLIGTFIHNIIKYFCIDQEIKYMNHCLQLQLKKGRTELQHRDGTNQLQTVIN